MNPIYQDVTLTLNLTSMTQEEYQRLVAIAEALGDGNTNTFTYNEDGNENLDEEQQNHVGTLLSN